MGNAGVTTQPGSENWQWSFPDKMKTKSVARRDGRVAEGARLESVYTLTGIGGSNPSLSASCPGRDVLRSGGRRVRCFLSENEVDFVCQFRQPHRILFLGGQGG